jgi:hypothetical protein
MAIVITFFVLAFSHKTLRKIRKSTKTMKFESTP